MKKPKFLSSKADKILPPDVREQLKQIFAALPHKIPVHLFSRKEDDQKELQAGRDLLAAFQEISDNIQFEDHDTSHNLAEKYGISHTPTLVFAPEQYNIHYLGVPMGEEGRTLVETLILVGMRQSQFNDQAIRIMDRIDGPRKIRVFVSSSCPYCPQQAVNAVKAAIAKPEYVSVEIVDTGFNPELAEHYSAYSVPQTFANDVLIGKGAQPQELFVSSLEKMEEQTYFIPTSDAQKVETDLVIVGGGPAGLTAGIYAARSGLKAVIIERDALGGQVATTPVVENYPGLAQVGGKNLVDIMVAHALKYVAVYPGETVMEIKPGEPMEVVTSLRQFTARAVLLATGASHQKLDVPGEARFAGRGVSYCSTCDGPLFKGKKVVMIGGGNSAVTEALHLHHIGAHVTLIHRRDALRAQEHLVKNLEDNQIPILWNTEVKEIHGREKVTDILIYNNQTDKTEEFPTDGVFISIGYTPAVELANLAGVELTPEGYIKQDNQHRTNVPGIYSAGDVEGGYKQIVTAAGAGAGAAMTIFEDLTNPYWKDADRHKQAGGD